MNEKQIWQTIALDLKRAANYLYAKRQRQAKYYLDESRRLYRSLDKDNRMSSVKDYIKFEGSAEDILLGSSLILGRV